MWSKLRSFLAGLIYRLRGNYKVWVIHTTEEVGLYRWDRWKEIMPMVSSLLSISDRKAYIRSFQCSEHAGGNWLGFGRMSWNEENNRKWTTKYLEADTEKMRVRFCDTEVWAPDWNYCNEHGGHPDLFFRVYHSPGVEGLLEGLIIAIPMHLHYKHEELISTQLERIRSIVAGSGVSSIVRGWGGRTAVRNAIEFLNEQEILKIIAVGTRS